MNYEASLAPGTSSSKISKNRKKRKLHTYEKAKLAYEEIQKAKEKKKEAIEQRKQEREIALKRSKDAKKRRIKCLYKKTKRGQPKLGHQVEFLLEKIKKQTQKSST